jgi:acyl carrier protein
MEQLFIENFKEAVEVESVALSVETKFRELEEWDSLAGLSVIAMIDEEYDVILEGNEFKSLETIGELISAIQAKQNK